MEQYAQQALGHGSKAVHHAYSKHAGVTVASLDDWERRGQEAEREGQRSEDGSQEAGTREAEMPRPGLAKVVALATA